MDIAYWSFQIAPLAPWTLLLENEVAIPFVFLVLSMLGGFGLWLLQHWGRILLLAAASFPWLTCCLGLPGASQFNTRVQAMVLRFVWTLMLTAYTIFVLGSPECGVVTTRSYRQIIEQTPGIGPPRILRTAVYILVLVTGLMFCFDFLVL